MKLITCEYCGVSYQKFESLCTSCGAPMPIHGVTAVALTDATFPIAIICEICAAYADARPFYPGIDIPPQILAIALKSFPTFPQAEDIFLFCDTTPMGSGVWGFVISQDGVYWKNNTAVASKHTYLTWTDFAQRKVKRHKDTLNLGEEDVINLAGLGSATFREKAERLLKEIRSLLDEETINAIYARK